MTTEFMQPINPVRIITAGESSVFTHPVFAIAISNDHHVEYLTVNGSFYQNGSILFAEQFIDGKWTRLEYHPKLKVSPAPLDG